MDKDLGLKVLGKAFNVTNLTQLEKEVNYSSITKNRVKFEKTSECLSRQIMRSASRGMYEYAVSVLSKYGTEEMVERFKKDNKNAFEPSIMDSVSSTYIIDVDKDALFKHVSSRYHGNYDNFELEEVVYNGKTYWIVWK